MKLIIILLGVLFTSTCYGQTYIYTFEGEIDPFLITEMEHECAKLASISTVKIKYKAESMRGEMFIILDSEMKEKRGSADDQFSPKELKSFLLDRNLSPLSFRERTN